MMNAPSSPSIGIAATFWILAVGATAGDALAARPAPAARAEAPRESGDAEFPAIEDLERELSRMVALTRNSVVRVVSKTPVEILLERLDGEINLSLDSAGALARRVGSGVVIDNEGHIATLSSVVSGAREVVVVCEDGRTLLATLKGADDYSGVAVLSLSERDASLEPLGVGDPGELRVGSLVTAIESSGSDSPGYSFGFFSGKGMAEGPLRGGRFLKINAHASPGAGGGPVLDSKGRLVGIVFAGSHGGEPVIHWEMKDDAGSHAEEREIADLYFRALHRTGAGGGSITYAIPVDVVLKVADQIIRTGQVRRGWLGVTIESTEPGEIRLTRVSEDSPASRADLRAGDLVRSLDGSTVASASEMVETLSYRGPGSRVVLGVERAGRRLLREIVLGDSPEPTRVTLRSVWKAQMSRPPTLGVQVRQSGDGRGLVVTRVHAGSRAQEAGILPGDLMLDAGGKPLRSIGELRRALGEQGDEEMIVNLVRDEHLLALNVPPAPPAPPAPPDPPAPPRRNR